MKLPVRYRYLATRGSISVDQKIRVNARLVRYHSRIWLIRVRARLTKVPLETRNMSIVPYCDDQREKGRKEEGMMSLIGLTSMPSTCCYPAPQEGTSSTYRT